MVARLGKHTSEELAAVEFFLLFDRGDVPLPDRAILERESLPEETVGSTAGSGGLK